MKTHAKISLRMDLVPEPLSRSLRALERFPVNGHQRSGTHGTYGGGAWDVTHDGAFPESVAGAKFAHGRLVFEHLRGAIEDHVVGTAVVTLAGDQSAVGSCYHPRGISEFSQ